jgi:leucyl/phenylalanyl-tRNA---protein transferase
MVFLAGGIPSGVPEGGRIRRASYAERRGAGKPRGGAPRAATGRPQLARCAGAAQNGRMSRRNFEVTPELMLRAYRAGLFPMAETRRGERLYWLDPEMRGVLSLDGFHLPRRLRRTLRGNEFAVTSDTDFAGTIAGCAAAAPGREDTWINSEIERLFTELHRMGHAHSVECRQDGALVGGLYGVSLGGVFFGESMFSTARDASKVALVHLVARLRLGGYRLLDTQFVTTHLAQFGAAEIPRDEYKALLAAAVDQPARWTAAPPPDALDREIAALAARQEP